MIYAGVGNSGTAGEHNITGDEYDILGAIGVPDGVPCKLWIQNVGANPLYVGPAGSATYGFKLAAGKDFNLNVPADGSGSLRVSAFTSSTTIRALAATGD
jgi:hypothetical protein